MQLEQIQDALRRQNLSGWLFFDHHQKDPLAYRILGFDPGRHVTRRWYYLIPAQGEPRKLVHRIEADMLDPLPGEASVVLAMAGTTCTAIEACSRAQSVWRCSIRPIAPCFTWHWWTPARLN